MDLHDLLLVLALGGGGNSKCCYRDNDYGQCSHFKVSFVCFSINVISSSAGFAASSSRGSAPGSISCLQISQYTGCAPSRRRMVVTVTRSRVIRVLPVSCLCIWSMDQINCRQLIGFAIIAHRST